MDGLINKYINYNLEMFHISSTKEPNYKITHRLLFSRVLYDIKQCKITRKPKYKSGIMKKI